MTTRTTAWLNSGRLARLKGWGRLRRARTLYAYGQSVAARGQPDGSRRAARLYRRALQLLEPAAAAASALALDRQLLRDRVRAELGHRGWLGLVRRWPRAAKALLGVLILAALVRLGVSIFEPDLAEGKPWVASSAWGSFPRSGVMSGEAAIDGRFHTLDEQDPWVQLDLGRVCEVHAVRVHNRTNCCRERALPLAIELSVDGRSWRRVGYRRILFDTFTQHFSSSRARYVRLRVDRRSTLHLRRISVF